MSAARTTLAKTTFTIEQILAGTHGSWVVEGARSASGLNTDSRKISQGSLFIPLRGDAFDGHQFLGAAAQGGAAIVLSEAGRWQGQNLPRSISVVEVADTLQALQDLAQYWREQMSARVMAVTGSNGKTTTKLFLAELMKEQFSTAWTGGSLNNHWGVPMTLLETQPQTQWTICEMGMNHLGEIKRLCEIAQPDVVGVTMVGRAHIEHLGSQENIATAKYEIYLGARSHAVRVYGMDNPWTLKMAEQHQSRFGGASQRLLFSTRDPRADVHVTWGGDGADQVRGHFFGREFTAPVSFFGQQNVSNLACALALAGAAGLSWEHAVAGISRCSTGWGRNQWLGHPSGARILFDAYNSNPDSMQALLNNLEQLPRTGERYAVFGEMRELGPHAAQLHEEVGRLAARVGFSQVWFVGAHGEDFERGLRSGGFDKNFVKSGTCEKSFACELASVLSPRDIVAIKASRGVGLEKVLDHWGMSLPKG